MNFKKIFSIIAIIAASLFLCSCNDDNISELISFIDTDENSSVSSWSSEESSSVTEFTSETDDFDYPPPHKVSELIVHFIDVGQGDSTFIELPNGETMLIDAGETSEGDKITDYIFSLGHDSVDYVIATHPHADHIGGMPAVMDNFIVKNFFLTNTVLNSKDYDNMLNAVNSNGADIHYTSAGDVILNESDLLVEIAAPKTTDVDNPNDTSIVTKLTYKNTKFLFAGDAEKFEEDNIWTNIKCDVLKVGHHGSSTSTSQNFLKKVEPQYAVISCGLFNKYGHPAEKVLESLADKRIRTYRTDLQGTITFYSDGESITVNKEPIPYDPPINPTSSADAEQSAASAPPDDAIYILNTSTKRIHYPSCTSVDTIKEKNKAYTDDYADAISRGYNPCNICKP